MKKYRRTLPILTMLLLLSGCGVTKVTMETQSPIMATDAVMELPPTEVQRTTEAEETIPVWESLMEMDEASAEESAVPTETQTSIEAESCPPQQAQEEIESTMEQTEPPMTEPPVTEPLTTMPTEPIPPTPTVEPEPSATEAPTEPSEAETTEITYEFKRQVASFVAQYLNSYRSSPCTVLSGMSQVAQYRASQLTWNFAHSTADKRAALAYYGYGRWVDATLAGLEESDSYYESDTAEAICRNFHGNTPEELGKAIADLIRNSSSHWSYVGSSEYSYMGIGVEYQNGWYACIMVGTVNYG